MLTLLTAEAVESSFRRLNLPFKFTPEEKTPPTTIPVVKTGARVLGFATPADNQGINILNLRRLLGVDPRRPPSFFDHPWYLEETFSLTDCAPGWHFIEMEVEKGSLEQTFNYSYSLRHLGVVLPTAIEVVLMLFLHFTETGEQLLVKKHTWCRDAASLGRSVTVGAFGRNGVFISGHPQTFASRGLGICGKLIPNQAPTDGWAFPLT